MKVTTQHIHGRLIEQNGRYSLLLHDPTPSETADLSLYLRFALVKRGPETHIFPAELLDDWGQEVKGLRIYRWIDEFGNEFPRAEVFGVDRQGGQTQCFVRDLEIYFKLPCYVYTSKEQPIADGVPIEAILLPSADVTAAQKSKPPADWQRPLASAAVKWWQVPPDMRDLP